MSRNSLYVVALVSAVLLASAVPGTQAPQGQHEDMAARCKAMMAQHEKMMGDMKAADQRLDGLVSKMNAASGQAKVDAIAAAVTEIVAQVDARLDDADAPGNDGPHGGAHAGGQGVDGHVPDDEGHEARAVIRATETHV